MQCITAPSRDPGFLFEALDSANHRAEFVCQSSEVILDCFTICKTES